MAAQKWKEVDNSVKASYNNDARTYEPKVLCKKREMGRVLSQLSNVVSWIILTAIEC